MSDDLTLLAAWREGDAASGRLLVERHFTAMYRFFANKVAGHWRDRKPSASPDWSVSRLVDAQITPADAIAKGQEQRLLLRTLRLLPLELQVLIELAYFEGLTDREVATVVELPVGTVKSRLRKGRLLLHEHMTATADAALVASTQQGFEGWCASIRRHMGAGSGGHR